MRNRMLLAVGAALAVVGSSRAQAPKVLTPLPAQAPPVVADEPASALDFPWRGAEDPRPDGQVWATAEYLMAWFSGDRLPSLVTTSPAGTPQATAGISGLPTTTTLFGNGTLNEDLRSGFRVAAGYWLTDDHRLGIEAGFTMLESQASLFSAASNGSPILARPYFDTTTNTRQAVLIAYPGSSSGSIDVRDRSGDFYMANVDLAERFVDCGWVRIDALLGYRYYRYDDGLHVAQTISPTAVNFAAGTQLASTDEFTAESTFHGGDFGLRTQFWWQNFSLDLLTKLAVGGVNRRVEISGNTVTTVPGAGPAVQEGGVFALSSNIGTFHSRDWALVPELGATLGWQATDNVRVTAGYSVLGLERIARAADQIDLGLNPNLFPPAVQPLTGPNRPTVNLIRNDTWIQTLSFGVEILY